MRHTQKSQSHLVLVFALKEPWSSYTETIVRHIAILRKSSIDAHAWSSTFTSLSFSFPFAGYLLSLF